MSNPTKIKKKKYGDMKKYLLIKCLKNNKKIIQLNDYELITKQLYYENLFPFSKGGWCQFFRFNFVEIRVYIKFIYKLFDQH